MEVKSKTTIWNTFTTYTWNCTWCSWSHTPNTRLGYVKAEVREHLYTKHNVEPGLVLFTEDDSAMVREPFPGLIRSWYVRMYDTGGSWSIIDDQGNIIAEDIPMGAYADHITELHNKRISDTVITPNESRRFILNRFVPQVAKGDEPKRTQYEYNYCFLTKTTSISVQHKLLNQWGIDGWEFTGAIVKAGKDGSYYLMKREKTS